MRPFNSRDYELLNKAKVVSPLGVLKEGAEEGNETNYETALSNIAHAYVNDISPDLIPYALGFQLVEKSEDNNKALGIFGFKKDDLLLYIPVFFINGEIKGIDLMYVYNLKKFVPNMQEMVRKLLSMSNKIGQSISPIDLSGKAVYPNLFQLKPTALKWASDLPRWLRPFAGFLYENKNFPKVFHKSEVLNLLEKSASARYRLASFLDEYPKWISSFHDVYGDDLIRIFKQAKKASSLIYDPKAVPNPRQPVFPTFDTSNVRADVEIFRRIHPDAKHKLTEEELNKLREQGYFVKDRRKYTAIIRSKTNDIYHSSSISKPGFYNLLLVDGRVLRAYVVPLLKDVNKEYIPKNNSKIVRYKDMARELLVVPLYITEIDRKNVLKKFDGKYAFSVSSRQVVKTTDPKDADDSDFSVFKNITELLKEDDKTLDKYSNIYIFTEKEAIGPLQINLQHEKRYGGKIAFVCYNGFGSRPVSVVFSPHTTKIRKIYEHDSNNVDIYEVPYDAKIAAKMNDNADGNKDSDLVHLLATTDTLPNLALKFADRHISVIKLGADEYSINNVVRGRFDLFTDLILKFNLSENDAKRVILETDRHGERSYLCKEAFFTGMENKMIPATNVPPMDVNMGMVGQFGPNQMSVPASALAQSDNVQIGPLNPNDPIRPASDLDRELQQAIASGQKEVFDTTVFSDLLNSVDDFEIINRYLPKIYSGMDVLGRLLFNMYLHHEIFVNRYGKDNVKEIENLLRTTFKNVGKTILSLEKKSPNYNGLDIFTMLTASE